MTGGNRGRELNECACRLEVISLSDRLILERRTKGTKARWLLELRPIPVVQILTRKAVFPEAPPELGYPPGFPR